MEKNKTFDLTFWGVGGSCPTSKPDRKIFGVNTPCVSTCVEDEYFIFDMGSGLLNFSNSIGVVNEKKCFHIFISHYHFDHLEGLLFFGPLFNANATVHFYGHPWQNKTVLEILKDFLSPPHFPVGFEAFSAEIHFHVVNESDSFSLCDEKVKVSTMPISHPNACTAYRMNYQDKSFTYMTDIELSCYNSYNPLQAFAKDTNMLIVDAYFDHGDCKAGWGHSTWREAAQLAKESNAETLALFHYNYQYSDKDIENFINSAKKTHFKTMGAIEQQAFSLI